MFLKPWDTQPLTIIEVRESLSTTECTERFPRTETFIAVGRIIFSVVTDVGTIHTIPIQHSV